MNKTPFALLLAAFLWLASCSKDSEALLLPGNDTEPTATERLILANVAVTRTGAYHAASGLTRAGNGYCLKPYIEEGDTLLYIVQYDEGWEIYSASQALPMILVSNATGRLDLSSSDLPPAFQAILSNAKDAVKSLKNQKGNIPMDSTWVGLNPTPDLLMSAKSYVNNGSGPKLMSDSEDYPPGEWRLIEVWVVDSKTRTSLKLTKTSWGQRYPWNTYAKWAEDSTGNLVQCTAGCAPVAVAQYLYHTNQYENIPATSPSRGLLNIDGTDYLFSAYTSATWSQMAINQYQYGADYSALLIGKTGRSLKSTYTPQGTSTNLADITNYLNSTYGQVWTYTDMNSGLVQKSIDSNRPLIANIYSTKDYQNKPIEKVGHTLLIDQYSIETTTARYLYALVRDPLPPGTEDTWESDEYDDKGNIVEYAYTKQKDITSDSYSVSMNWGWNGSYNNVFYYPYSINWNAGGYIFNSFHGMYYR